MAAQPEIDGISKTELQPEVVSADIQATANQFLVTYYNTFDNNRMNLVALYTPESRMTFEGETYTGAEKIGRKLYSLSFTQVVHEVTTFDCHLTLDSSLLIFVVGRMKTDDNAPLGFSQVFNLKQIGDSLFIINDFFRLSLHNS